LIERVARVLAPIDRRHRVTLQDVVRLSPLAPVTRVARRIDLIDQTAEIDELF